MPVDMVCSALRRSAVGYGSFVPINRALEEPLTFFSTTILFVATAIAEIVGCYLPLLWLTRRAPVGVLLPAAASLALFVWLLTLHPTSAGRVYAAYGGVYVATAVAWLWLIDGVRPTAWDLLGSAIAVLGMAIIVLAPRR